MFIIKVISHSIFSIINFNIIYISNMLMFIIIIFSNIYKRNTPNKCSSLYVIHVIMYERASCTQYQCGRKTDPADWSSGPTPA